MAWTDEMIPADLTVEHKGANIPLREHEFVKSAPDFQTFLKSAFDAHTEVGRRIPLPKDDAAKAKWKEEHLPKLREAGLVEAPFKPPEKYEVKLPDGIPAEAWSEDDTKIAEGFAKKYGLSQDALNDGIAVVAGILGKHGADVQVNREASQAKIKEWAEKEGLSIEQVNAALDRFNKDPRGWDEATAQAISKSGFADNPLVVQAIVKLMTDSGTFDFRGDGGRMEEKSAEGNAAAMEAKDIIRNKENPKHAAYHRGDPEVGAYVEQLMKKAHPGTLEI